MGSFNSDWGRVTFWISTSWRCKLYSNWTNVCDKKLSIKQCTKVWWQVNFFQIEGDRCWCHTSSLLMSNSCLWGGLNCKTCWFLHPPSNLLPAIYCYQASDMWQVISWENVTYMTLTVDSTFTRRIQGYVETLWWMAIGRSWLEKWRSSFMLLTIQTTTTAWSSNKLFNTVLMVNSASKAFLNCM